MTTGPPSCRQYLEKSLRSLHCSARGCPAMSGIWQDQVPLVIKKNIAHHTRNSKEQKDLSFPLFKFLSREGKKGCVWGKSVLFVHSFLSLLLFHTGNVPEARSELWVNSMCTHSGQLAANHLAHSLFPDNKLPWLLSLISNWNKHPLHF